MVSYEDFLKKLKQPEALPLTNHLKGFLAHFTSERRSVGQQRKLVLQFLNFAHTESLMNPTFSGATEDSELESIREGWEKLVMTKLFDTVFGAPGTEEHKMNAHLQRKIESFHWVEERHLDLPFELQHTLEVAQAELLRVNGFRSPKDKLTILLNTMQLIAGIIQNGHENAGNDHLLPVLILCIIRANPQNLISNVKYIMRFRNQEELQKGATQFCLTNMMGAISYIYNLSTKSLTLTDQEKTAYARELPKQDTVATSSSAPEIGTFANKAYSTTTGWFGDFIKNAKVFGETAAEAVDGIVTSLTGPDSPPQPGPSVPGGPALPPRRAFDQDGRTYPGQIGASAARQSSLAPPGQGHGQSPVTVFTPSPGGPQQVSPTSGYYTHLTAEQRAEQEDYELQLALALSLSSMEDRKATQGDGEGSLMQFDEEEPLLPRAGQRTEEQAAPTAATGAATTGTVEDEDEEPLLPSKKKAEVPELKQLAESVEKEPTGGIADVEYARLEEPSDSVPPPKPVRKDKGVDGEEEAGGGSKLAGESLI